jgi:hypothetical protein
LSRRLAFFLCSPVIFQRGERKGVADSCEKSYDKTLIVWLDSLWSRLRGAIRTGLVYRNQLPDAFDIAEPVRHCHPRCWPGVDQRRSPIAVPPVRRGCRRKGHSVSRPEVCAPIDSISCHATNTRLNRRAFPDFLEVWTTAPTTPHVPTGSATI